MGYGLLLNLGSVLFGLAAWGLPVVWIVRRRMADTGKSLPVIAAVSFGACAASLLMVILYMRYLISWEDWPALLDTSYMFALLSFALLAGAVILNIAAAVVCLINGRKQAKADRSPEINDDPKKGGS